MIEKKLKELYCVDTISQDKGWKKVSEAIKDIEEDILIDFSSTNVVEPWNCNEFLKLLGDKRVHMRFVNSIEIVNRIHMAGILNGIDSSRVENCIVEVPKEKTPEEKKIERFGNELIPLFDITTDNIAMLDVRKKYSQMYSTNTINYIDYAIREIHKAQQVNNFILVLGKISILDNVLEMIANLIVEYQSLGISLSIDVDDEKTCKQFGLYMYNATNQKYDEVERHKAILNTLQQDTPGMLIKYKKSKATDDFGRHGKGEVVSSRIAIFRKIETDKDNNPVMIVETFNSNYFYTKQQWMVEHDNEEATDLHKDTLEIPLMDVGICDLFLGSHYHFILPIQQDLSESQTLIVDLDDEGRNIKKVCTIPERMQVVFDDWGIKYNKDSLAESIKLTHKQLGIK